MNREKAEGHRRRGGMSTKEREGGGKIYTKDTFKSYRNIVFNLPKITYNMYVYVDTHIHL